MLEQVCGDLSNGDYPVSTDSPTGMGENITFPRTTYAGGRYAKNVN